MARSYSVLIVPAHGPRLRRIFFSKRLLGIFLCGVGAWMALGAFGVGNYFWMRLRKRDVERLVLDAREQQKQLSTLYQKTGEVEELVKRWKGLRDKVQASLPAGAAGKARIAGGERSIGDLEKRVESLKDELGGLIASVPAEWPVQGRVSSGVGLRSDPFTGRPEFHAGLDIPDPAGTPVRAPADGVVAFAGPKSASGRLVVIDHGQGIVTKYAHLSETNVQAGERVVKGERIAAVGNTGKSTSAHLHYELRVDGVPIDPRRHLLELPAAADSGAPY